MEITKLEFHPYSLTPRSAPNRLSGSDARSGALLRVSFADRKLPGHADLFPWPELGDMPLSLQLETLRERTPLPLALSSLLWAYQEARARDLDESYFPGPAYASHITAIDRAAIPANAHLVKLKVTTEDVSEWQRLTALAERIPGARWRLDFNGLFDDYDRAYEFWTKLPFDYQDRVDFIEDPMTVELMGNPELHQVFPGAQIAVDRSPTVAALQVADVLVMKPMLYSPEVFLTEAESFGGKIVITSSMDHPVGQLQALRAAQLLLKEMPDKLLPGGLLTHDLYAPHAQSSWVGAKDLCLTAPLAQGPGLGLSEPLGRLAWQELT